LENTEQHLKNLLQSASWTAEDRDWLRSYLEGDMVELKAIAFKEYNNDLLSLTRELDEKISIQLLDDLHRQLKIGSQAKKIKLWPRIAVAAAVAVVIFGAGLFYFGGDSRLDPVKTATVVNDIAPGKNGATITLANGKVIQLSDSKTGVVIEDNSIKYNDGSFLSPSGREGVAREGNGSNNPLSPEVNSGQAPQGDPDMKSGGSMMLTASTAKGQTYQFTLPDGTKVWLNADSKLEFPSKFENARQRIVRLSGEGYFEVAKVSLLSPSGRDGRRPERVPFIVATDKQQVEVLGTHFNINSYPDEKETKTTLLEGSVRVAPLSAMGRDAEGREVNGKSATLSGRSPSLPEGERSVILKPNQQSILIGSNRLNVKEVDVGEAVAWKNGEFVFENESVQSIMRKIARWYDVEVIYEGDVANKEIWGSVSKYEQVSKVLEMLAGAQTVDFEIRNKTIVVKPFKLK
jgi:ferric-dicitrate binding protein FerR (iron transport regulator)